MGSDLKTWVSDRLMSLLGYSQPTVVQYVISLSKNAKSSSEIFGALNDMGVSSASETRVFAEEIFAKVGRKSSGVNLYQQQEKEAAMLAKKQRTYKLLEAEDDDDVGTTAPSNSVSVAPRSRKVDKHGKRFRKKNENQEDEDDEVVVNSEEGRRVKQRTSKYDDDDDDSESEEERLRDQREREELEQSLKSSKRYRLILIRIGALMMSL